MFVLVKRNKRVYLYSENHKILNMSEQYATMWNAKRAAKRMFADLPLFYEDNNGKRTAFSA